MCSSRWNLFALYTDVVMVLRLVAEDTEGRLLVNQVKGQSHWTHTLCVQNIIIHVVGFLLSYIWTETFQNL